MFPVAPTDIPQLIKCLAQDLGIDSWSTKYITQRFRNEGWVFISKTLPQLEQVLYKSLEIGYFPKSDATKSFAYQGSTLKPFARLLNKIYNKAGFVKQHYCKRAFSALTQFFGYWYKVCTKFSEKLVNEYVETFTKTDDEIRSSNERYFSPANSSFRKELYNFTKHTFKGCAPTFDALVNEQQPRFGPGTYAGKSNYTSSEDLEKDWFMQKLPEIWGPTLTSSEHAYLGSIFGTKQSFYGNANIVQDTSDHSEVLFVPKNAKGPRTIVREPLYKLRMQMAFFDYFSRFLQRKTKRSICFDDQTKNKDLARQASITGADATIDLASASDRVSFAVISDLFRDINAVSVPLRKFRSDTCVLPNGDVRVLLKLAGMGSGFTFPMLAYLVYASTCVSIHLETKISYRDICTKVHTYGDDLIVPTEWKDFAYQGLKSVGLVVNEQKSFVGTLDSKFRESCGGNFANGFDVTITRLRQSAGLCERPKYISDLFANDNEGSYVQSILQLERHCREIVKAGLLKLADKYYSVIESQLALFLKQESYKLPYASGDFPGLCRYVDPDTYVPEFEQDGRYRVIRALVPSNDLCRAKAADDPFLMERLHRYELAMTLKGQGFDADTPTKQGRTLIEAIDSLESGRPEFRTPVPNSFRLTWRDVSSIACSISR